MDEVKTKTLEWLLHAEDKGISSKAMASVFLGSPTKTWHGFGNHPSDPADFNRCLKLLAAVPEARKMLPQVAMLSPVWNRYVKRWDELETMFLGEVGLDWSKGRKLPATNTFNLMMEIQRQTDEQAA